MCEFSRAMQFLKFDQRSVTYFSIHLLAGRTIFYIRRAFLGRGKENLQLEFFSM